MTVANGAVLASDLITIDANTTAVVNASAVVTSITGSAAQFATLVTTNAETTTLAANYTATITDAATVAQANVVDADTTGVVTATLSDNAIATLANLTGTGNAYTVTVTDASVDAAALNTLDGKTTVNVTATAVTTLTGTAAAIATAISAATIDTAADVGVTVANGAVLASDLITIDANTTAVVNASAVVTSITGSAAQFATLVTTNAETTTLAANYNASITGVASVTQINQVDSDTVGTISVESVTDSFVNILSLAVNNSAVLNAASGTVTAEGSVIGENASFSTVGHGLTILALGGNDEILGTTLNDIIVGGTGSDVLYGGGGSDIFQYAAGDSTTGAADQVMDFASSNDKLDLSGTATVAANQSNVNVASAAGGSDILASVVNGIVSLTGADIGNVDLLSEWVAIARLVNTTTNAAVAFEFDDGVKGLGTYVYQENASGNSSSDLLVFLYDEQGVTSLSANAGGANTLWIA
ncbi:hypothetical protein FJY94_06995 [Candidatus Kaiserbacteria bacterium]|nr:hypothetical protein [Candidatus Kaiserbacteria bacterium]